MGQKLSRKTAKMFRFKFVLKPQKKRSIVEPLAPPHSFIAVDDFDSVHELAAYLRYLMDNKTAYLYSNFINYREYFKWKMDYRAVFLDGVVHNELERPWGLCQLCRIIWEEPRKTYIIKDFHDYWSSTCEKGEVVQARIRSGSSETKKSHNGI
ncbi:hypothetical protein Y032_0228g2879 [Ancylostoma ceylanicum]|uniref:Fucosyltransferase n=1 Tax=Ancylostoma ceylanicum TaxID=53326 RepID=A0A016SHB2_9BILA|nr:hypothetical protein Y032_0228g2879 [Ancylostoma ceylanicum]